MIKLLSVSVILFSTAIQVEDEGSYMCILQNHYGRLELQATLSVSGLCELCTLVPNGENVDCFLEMRLNIKKFKFVKLVPWILVSDSLSWRIMQDVVFFHMHCLLPLYVVGSGTTDCCTTKPQPEGYPGLPCDSPLHCGHSQSSSTACVVAWRLTYWPRQGLV